MFDYHYLVKLRTDKGLSQKELADLTGVSENTVNDWETGISEPGTAVLLSLARALGTTADDLLSGGSSDDSQAPETPRTPEISEGETAQSEAKPYSRKPKPDEIISWTVFVIGICVFLIIGVAKNLWHPYWAIIPISFFAGGAIGEVANLFGKGKNTAIKAVGNLILCLSLVAFFVLGAFYDLWKYVWIIPVVGVVFSILISMFEKKE